MLSALFWAGKKCLKVFGAPQASGRLGWKSPGKADPYVFKRQCRPPAPQSREGGSQAILKPILSFLCPQGEMVPHDPGRTE